MCRGDPFDTATMSKASKKLLKEHGMTNDMRRIVDAVAPADKAWHRCIEVIQSSAGPKN